MAAPWVRLEIWGCEGWGEGVLDSEQSNPREKGCSKEFRRDVLANKKFARGEDATLVVYV